MEPTEGDIPSEIVEFVILELLRFSRERDDETEIAKRIIRAVLFRRAPPLP
jgi:hypothetical protein